jgi:hypothetical protein
MVFPYEGAFTAYETLHKPSLRFTLMSDEKTNDEPNDKFEHEHVDKEMSIDDEDMKSGMSEYLHAFNHFIHMINEMEWPENLPLKNDEKLCMMVFRTYWRQRVRQHRESMHRQGQSFEHMNKEKFREFMHGRFIPSFIENDETFHINPGNNQPDDDHEDEESKQRQDRFREKWE